MQGQCYVENVLCQFQWCHNMRSYLHLPELIQISKLLFGFRRKIRSLSSKYLTFCICWQGKKSKGNKWNDNLRWSCVKSNTEEAFFLDTRSMLMMYQVIRHDMTTQLFPWVYLPQPTLWHLLLVMLLHLFCFYDSQTKGINAHFN